MLDKHDVFSLNILPRGQVEVLRKTIITEDGQAISEKNWRVVLEPGQFSEAQSLLPAYEMGVVQAAWTPEKIAAFLEWKASISQ